MSTPSNSASGNINPASMTMMSSPQRMAMQFMPNSPSPPSGTTCNLPLVIDSVDASTASDGDYSQCHDVTRNCLYWIQHENGPEFRQVGFAKRLGERASQCL